MIDTNIKEFEHSSGGVYYGIDYYCTARGGSWNEAVYARNEAKDLFLKGIYKQKILSIFIDSRMTDNGVLIQLQDARNLNDRNFTFSFVSFNKESLETVCQHIEDAFGENRSEISKYVSIRH